MDNKEWETIAHLPVDAGCMMIIDPCYLLDNEEYGKQIASGSRELYLGEVLDLERHKTILGDLGALVETGYGDGEYPVQIRYNSSGRVAEVRVVFDDENSGPGIDDFDPWDEEDEEDDEWDFDRPGSFSSREPGAGDLLWD